MVSPTAAFSVSIRVRLDNTPGTLGKLAAAIGGVGGNIVALEGFEARDEYLDEDLIVNCISEAHIEVVVASLDGIEGLEVISVSDRTFAMHAGGKIEVLARMPVADRDDLSMAYTPGVARICTEIEVHPEKVHDLTIKKNTVAIVTDGTAVLGLGDIGPEASLPVMEGKALLFKNFAGVDGFPICIDAGGPDTPMQDRIDAIVETVERVAPVFGGINLEDISAPACFEVEDRLRASLDIPVFHDDQHGTAVVTLAALENSLKLVGKRMEDLRIVICGAGAAGVAIAKMLIAAGVTNIVACDTKGAIHKGRTDLNVAKQKFADITNPEQISGSLQDVLPGADVFIGVSAPDQIDQDDLRKMAHDPIVFAMSNPNPEIRPELAKDLVAVMATGRSDYPNQINNVLAFPGIFRGALDAGATDITENMKRAAATAIAECVSADELRPGFVIPSVFDTSVGERVAAAVAEAARADGVCRDQH
ncbi:NAD-dependent malic enzyme [Aquihabitans daechungensis]|uniref:NAD-dependent malic enzyme n=1 Tax=Aquihabitans daechungensis TaxID=1052257 RepID=UPI003B9F9C35